MSVPFASQLDALPVVPTTAFRTAFYPSTTRINTRVHNLETGNIERWNGTSWVTDFIGVGWSSGTGVAVLTGSAAPNGAVTGNPGWLYVQQVSTTASILWEKQSGTATNTGWAASAAVGTGAPEGAVTAPIGTLLGRADGSNGTVAYIKNSGTGNTGWRPLATSANEFNVLDYGAKGDGVTDDTAAIQAAIDAVDTGAAGGLVRLPGGHTFYLTNEIQLRADHCTFYAVGAAILGPVAGTGSAGDLFTIGDRRTPTRIITDAHVVGGRWQPQNAADNAVTIVAATQSSIRGVVCTMPTGTASAGVIVETVASCTDLLIDNCIVTGGGAQGIQVGLTGATTVLARVAISNCLCDGQVVGLVVRGDADTTPAVGVTVTNVAVTNCSGDGIQLVRVKDCVVTGCSATNVTANGIWLYQPDNTVVAECVVRSVAVPTSPKYGLLVQPGTALGPFRVSGLLVNGAWFAGVKPEAADGMFDGIHVDGAAYAIHNGSGVRTYWGHVTYHGITVNNLFNPASTTDVWGQINGTGSTFSGPKVIQPFSGTVTTARVSGVNGTAHVAGDYALSAGWGTTATVSAVSAKDAGGRVTISCSGTGQTANPTVTLTWKDGTWTTVPAVVASRGDLVVPSGPFLNSTPGATTVVFTFNGTPVAGNSYILDFVAMGK